MIKRFLIDFLLLPLDDWEKLVLMDIIAITSMFVALAILVSDAAGV